MKRRTSTQNEHKIAVDVVELASILSVGKATARRIGEQSGAMICLGSRKLYNVKKINEYIDSISGM